MGGGGAVAQEAGRLGHRGLEDAKKQGSSLPEGSGEPQKSFKQEGNLILF